MSWPSAFPDLRLEIKVTFARLLMLSAFTLKTSRRRSMSEIGIYQQLRSLTGENLCQAAPRKLRTALP